MRKILLQPPDTNDWKKWIEDCQKATQSNIEAFAQGKPVSIESRLYRHKNIKSTYFFSKNAPFYGKCAYCECPILDFQHGDIEHFRPKAGITDEYDQKIVLKDEKGNAVVDKDGKAKPHPGYYWLGYDWRNLIPSCVVCNQPTAGNLGKRNRFPVISSHAQSPGDEISEKPLLINPASGKEDDDPEKHLFVDISTGFMGHHSDRGEMCIRVFGLNDRDQLIAARKTATERAMFLLDNFRKTFKNLGDPGQSSQEVWKKIISYLDELIMIWEGREPYTMAAREVLKSQKFSLEWLYQKRQEFQNILSKE